MAQKGEYLYRGLAGKTAKNIVMPGIQWKEAVKSILMWASCFLMGRAVIFNEIAPFGVVLFACIMQRKRNCGLFLLAASLGIVHKGFNRFALKYIMAVLAVYVYGRVLRAKLKRWRNIHTALGVFVILILANLLYISRQNFLIYDMIVACLESIIGFLMVFVYGPVVDLFVRPEERGVLSEQEMVSICIFAALLVDGLWDVNLFGLSIKNILAVTLVLLFSYIGGPGTGAAVGGTIGLVTSLAGQTEPMFIGHFAVCGLIVGTFRGLGRLGSGCAFFLSNALMTFYINRSTETMLQFGEIGVSAGITMLIPLKMIERLKQLSDVRFEAMGNRQGHTNRLKELMVNRLEAFSQVYHRLAEAFSRVSQYNVMTGKEDLNKLLDLAVNQVCINCGLYKTCWQRNFYSTYNNMLEIISIIESKGRADRECIPSAISENCLQMDTVLDILNEAYDLYRINYRWRQKIDECRNLVARQLEGISKLITGLACELDVDIKFNKELEDAILFELDRQGIRVREVTVAEKTDGKIEVNVTKKSCGRRMECSRHVERVIGDILRKPMSCNFKRCNSGGRECVLQFVEAERYKIMTGVARRIKQYADACGDNYSSIPLDDGKYMLALSDGMGSGSRADAESSMVVSLLENFLEAGFDLDMTVHTINSVLILRSRDEIFATADLCVVDLIRASAVIGNLVAMSTFI